MKSVTSPSSLLGAFLLAVVAACAGCNQHGGSSGPTIEKRTPEEQFKLVIDAFRRKIEDQPVGFVVHQGGSRSTLVGTNKVSYEVIKPASTADQYKAVVTVESQSRYSLRRSKNDNENEQNGKNQSKSKNASTDLNEPKTIGVKEPDLTKPNSDNSSGSSKSAGTEEEIIARRPDDQVRKYELAYDKDHWSLVTKLNPDTERSIQFAFDEALSRQ